MPAHMRAHNGEDRGFDPMRLHRRLVILLIAIVVSAVASTAFIRSVGGTYVMRLPDFEGVTLSEESFQVTPEGMVEVASITYDGDVPVAELRAVAEGDGMLLVGTEDGGMMTALAVRPGLVVVEGGVNFTGWEAVGWSIAACFSVATLVFLWNLVSLLRRSWYGYEMAAYAGLSLFCAVQATFFLQVMLSGSAQSMSDLAMLIVSISDRFVWLLLPVVAVVALLVSASNMVLMRREGRSLTNLLGVALGIAIAVAVLVWRAFATIEFQTYAGLVASLGVNSVIATAISFGFALFVGTSLCALAAARHVPSMPRDFLVILGCGLRADGTPTPLLAGRTDAALAYARRQEEAGHKQPTFVPSGGKGDDEVWAEAESMRRYLMEKGVADETIVCEDQSKNTRENFRFSAQKIDAAKGASEPRVAFSTTNYHVFRSYMYAHEAGLDAEGIAAPTKLYFWPNAFLREFVGLLAARPVQILLAFALISVVYVGAEFIMLLG